MLYEKEYESLFASPEKIKKFLRKDTFGCSVMPLDEYIVTCREEIRKVLRRQWLDYIKINYLESIFTYNGVNKRHNHDGIISDTAFSMFFRYEISVGREGYNIGNVFRRQKTYYEDFYPGFMELKTPSPLENEEFYEFPYANIGPEYLLVVYQMEERLEMLEYANKVSMKYLDFLDFVINQALCRNEREGREKYEIAFYTSFEGYIKNNDISRRPTKKVKRKSYKKMNNGTKKV